MGFLGFLSRKPVPVVRESNLLKAQPYNATVAALPPVRGDGPVAGNGPSILETLQKTHPKLSNAQDISFGPHSTSSPASTLRDDKSNRPRTAPSRGRRVWSARERTDSLKDHPLPSMTPVPPSQNKQRPPYRLPDKEPEQPTRQGKLRLPYRLPGKTLGLPLLEDPPRSFHRERSSSMRSSQSGPAGAYVDLLDAHAGLYPTDFRQRVLATGARDFGEDVADRNLGKNASYTHLMEDPVRTSSRTSSQRPTSSALSAVKDSDGGAVFKSSKRYSLGSNLRTNSTVSDTGAAAPKPKRFPTDRELPLPKGRIRIDEDGSEGVAKPIKAVWRKSMPSSMSELHMRRDQDDGSDFPEALRVKSKAVFSVSRQEVNARQSVSPTGDPRHDRTYVSELSRYDDGNLDSNDPQEPVSKEVKTARRRTLNHTREPLTDQMDPKRLSLQNLQVLTSRLEGTESEIFPVKRETFDPTATTRARGNTVGSYDMPSTAELKIQASSSRNNSLPRHSPGRYQPQIEDAVRVRGLGSARTPCRIESDDAPERTSSMRKSSMDSTSATSQGSNPFRPHSRHTANTSVDMSPLSKDTNLSYVSLGAAPHRASPENRFRSSLATESMPSLDGSLHKPKLSTAFNIDDYISSDDDPEAPRHSRGEGEEHLLFRDTGFAFDGRGLPGISGSIDNATPRFVPASPPRRTAGDFRPINNRDLDDMMLETYRPARAEPRYNSLPSRPRRQMAAYRYEDSDPSDPEESQGLSGEPDDDLSFDIPMTRRPTPAQSYRPGRYASREQVIEEEREYDKVDLSTAMKLRKEEKRKKRLSGASGSTIRAYSNGGMPRSHKYDVAGLDADAE